MKSIDLTFSGTCYYCEFIENVLRRTLPMHWLTLDKLDQVYLARKGMKKMAKHYRGCFMERQWPSHQDAINRVGWTQGSIPPFVEHHYRVYSRRRPLESKRKLYANIMKRTAAWRWE